MAGTTDSWKLIRVAMIGLAASGGGFSVAEMADVLGARQWREENIAALMQAERDRDRLIALEAQARVLVQLVSDCAGIESEARIVVPEPAEPAEPFPTAPGAVRWGAIE